jgi:hypothetical protein
MNTASRCFPGDPGRIRTCNLPLRRGHRPGQNKRISPKEQFLKGRVLNLSKESGSAQVQRTKKHTLSPLSPEDSARGFVRAAFALYTRFRHGSERFDSLMLGRSLGET